MVKKISRVLDVVNVKALVCNTETRETFERNYVVPKDKKRNLKEIVQAQEYHAIVSILETNETLARVTLDVDTFVAKGIVKPVEENNAEQNKDEEDGESEEVNND